jgi:hypothetical protein
MCLFCSRIGKVTPDNQNISERSIASVLRYKSTLQKDLCHHKYQGALQSTTQQIIVAYLTSLVRVLDHTVTFRGHLRVFSVTRSLLTQQGSWELVGVKSAAPTKEAGPYFHILSPHIVFTQRWEAFIFCFRCLQGSNDSLHFGCMGDSGIQRLRCFSNLALEC